MGSPGYAKVQYQNLGNQGGMASVFADEGQTNYGQLTQEAAAQREALRHRAAGQGLMSTEMLRQGLQQQLAQQRSMAAGASPNNAAMAARNAAMNMGRASSGMSGQAAMAGLQEQKQAEDALTNAIMGARQQDMGVALGSRQNATNAFGMPIDPGKSKADEYAQMGMNAAIGGAQMFAMSDRRVKEDIKSGDSKAKHILAGLKSYSYRYKDEKNGKGEQFGPMAQEMERAGLGHAVIDTPRGKAVDGAKAALSGLALSAALARRVSKLEKKGK